MLNYRLRWSRQFSQHSLAELGRLFINVESAHHLTASEFEQIDAWVRAQAHVADVVLHGSDLVQQVQQMARLEQLVALGLLDGNTGSEIDNFQCPDFARPAREIAMGDLRITNLSLCQNLAQQPGFDDFSRALLAAGHSRLVVVDDYLDSRLSDLSAQFSATQTDWLLLKINGRHLHIGPAFAARDSSAACYQCLRYRIIQNSPVREWHRRHSQAEQIAPVPTVLARLSGTELKTLAQALIDDAGRGINSLWSAATYQPGDVQHHPLIKRPQCRHCGNPPGPAQRAAPRLQANPKHADLDGGYRTVARTDTLQKIRPLISPITGVISDLRKISTADGEQALTIYRAAYFQNSFEKSAPDADTFVQLALGKGVSDAQAQASALGEAMERLAAQYQGDEPVVWGPPSALDAPAFEPPALTPYSAGQYESFAQRSGVSLQHPQWVTAYTGDAPLHWLAGYSLTRAAPVYFPAAYCLANTPFEDRVHSLYNHNGNAAGNTREEAILQGSLELIERDAAAIWWYNQVPRPAMDLNLIEAQQLAKIDATLAPEWDYWVLDITNDIAVPSCAAIGQHKRSGRFVLGFGCHLDPAIACQRALTEMYQLITIKDDVSGPFDFNALSAHPFLLPKRQAPLRVRQDYPQVINDDLRDDVLYVQEALAARNLELCMVDYSRDDLPLKTLKVLIPGLCHFWPQFGNPRLYAVPVACGWLSRPLTETQLNPMALYL